MGDEAQKGQQRQPSRQVGKLLLAGHGCEASIALTLMPATAGTPGSTHGLLDAGHPERRRRERTSEQPGRQDSVPRGTPLDASSSPGLPAAARLTGTSRTPRGTAHEGFPEEATAGLSCRKNRARQAERR